ncbi:MAG: hypothetical protein OEV85_04545 [Candidatus Thorarchaeota archaeon]|nr:hypothetical protein [Candidatus Thorarchaeota archaeon]
MIVIQRQRGREHYSIGWLALFLVLLVSVSSLGVSEVSFDTRSLTKTITNSTVTTTSTDNRIAVVKPIFTATAYSNAFYTFYSRYSWLPVGEYITTDLNLFNRTVVDDWGWSTQLCSWFESDAAYSLHLVLGETVTLINEIDVDQGGLFHDGARLYDVVILGFTEYVTEREYLYYKQFVASGGTLIIMDACTFLAEVTYSNGYLSLTKGHGWEFNGTHAWKSVFHRWPENNTNWVGSNIWKYWIGNHYNCIKVNTTNALSDFLRTTLGENIYSSYRGHEENLLQNQTETDIIGYWNFVNPSECPEYPVAAYMHRYRDGVVIHSGIMASDVLASDEFLSVFLAASIRFGLTGEVCQWTYPEPLVSSDDFVKSTVEIYEKYGGRASETLSGLAYCDVNFNITTNVLRDCYQCNLESVTGEIVEQVDTDHQVLYDAILQARAVNNTCWRLDINTFLITNGNCRLMINATWEGVHNSYIAIETIEVLYFTVHNSWWISILPLAVPLGSVICAAIIIIAYNKINGTRS